MKKTISFLLNALMVSAGIALLSACVEEVKDAHITTLVLHSESGGRHELAEYKLFENCARSAMLWQAQVEPQYTKTEFECIQK